MRACSTLEGAGHCECSKGLNQSNCYALSMTMPTVPNQHVMYKNVRRCLECSCLASRTAHRLGQRHWHEGCDVLASCSHCHGP